MLFKSFVASSLQLLNPCKFVIFSSFPATLEAETTGKRRDSRRAHTLCAFAIEAHSGHRGNYKNARHKQCVKKQQAVFKKRGTMNWNLKSVAAITLAASAIGSFAYAS